MTNQNYPIHKDILVRILKDIYTDPVLGKVLGFKGGTAAYLCYGLPRSSVDLDFDLLNSKSQTEAWERLGSIIRGYGTIIDSYQKKQTLLYVIQYQKESWHIKLEVSLRPTVANYQPFSYLGIPLLVVDKPGMLSGKLSALIGRSNLASRDIFDVWYFLSNNWAADHKLIKDLTGKKLRQVYEQALKKVSSTPDNQLLQGMGELLTPQQKDWVKAKLKSELIFLLKLQLETKV